MAFSLVEESALPSDSVGRYLAGAALEKEFGTEHSTVQMRQRIEATRADGYAANPGLIVQGQLGHGGSSY